jgi:DNA-binding PadR family transcriptional regulator
MDLKRQISQGFWQGLVKLIVLHQANLSPVYGGRLSKYCRSLGYEISPGSLYPLLHSLEKAKLLHCRIKIFRGRTRKYYELTPAGQDCLEALRRELGEIVREVILGDRQGAAAAPPPGCALQGTPAVL